MSKDIFVLFPTMGKTREQNEEMLSKVNRRLRKYGYLTVHNANGLLDGFSEHELESVGAESVFLYRVLGDIRALILCERLYLCGEWWDDEECTTVRSIAVRGGIRVIYGH